MITARAPGANNTNVTLAPGWHTAALIALLLAVALTGTWLQHSGVPNAPVVTPANASRISTQYLPLFLVSAGLAAYCCRIFRGHNALPELLGERWRTVGRSLVDLGLAFGCFLLIMGVESLSARLIATGQNAAMMRLLPSTGAERLTWIVVAVSVGFCEEVVYRGYLQTQLAAFTGSRAAGVVLQAALFGVVHLEQGPVVALRIALYGLLFGALAHYRRNLRPGIACHVLVDLASVFLR